MLLPQPTVVCNESALIGEATPIQKAGIPTDAASSLKEHDPSGRGKRHVLFAGTSVVQKPPNRP